MKFFNQRILLIEVKNSFKQTGYKIPFPRIQNSSL